LPISDTLQSALWLIGASLPFYAITSATQTLFQAGERMELVMSVELIINTLILLGSIAVLWLGGSVNQVIGLLILTQLISALLGLLLLWRSGLMAGPQSEAPQQGMALGRRLLPFYTLSLADVLLQRIDLLLLSVIAGELVAGIYSAAYNLVRVLLKLVQSFLQAIYPTLSRLHRQAPLHYQQVADLSMRLGLLLLLPVIIVGTVSAGPVLQLVYNEPQLTTIPVLQTLLWTAPVLLVNGLVSLLLLIERRPRWSLLITGTNLISVMVLLPWLTDQAAASGAAMAVLGAGILTVLVSLGLVRQWHLPINGRALWGVLVASALIAAALWTIPTTWPIRLLVAGVLYLCLLGVSGQLSKADWRLLQSFLRH
jgi:O-antigen/teichoic acid export membrane protein